MIQTINLYDFRDAFRRYGRGEQFSYEGLGLIFDYIEEYEDSTGEQVELDVVALCCEWCEQSPEDIAIAYNLEIGVSEENTLQTVLEYLHDETQVAGVTDAGTVVYVQF
jgi:hypothetical protein